MTFPSRAGTLVAMPPPVTPTPAPTPREETLPYEVEKADRPSSRPPPAEGRAAAEATLVGVSARSPAELESVIVETGGAPDDELAKENGQRRREEARKTVSEVATRLGEGFRMAGQSLADSTAGDFETLLSPAAGTESSDPLTAMGARLVRESDFWRRLALRALGRASFADRLGYTAGVIAVTTSIGLAIVAGLGGLFAGGSVVGGRAWIVLAGALSVAIGAGVAFVLTHTVRRTQRDLAEQALARAVVAEARHHRLSAVLALRDVDPKTFRDALVQLAAPAAPHE